MRHLIASILMISALDSMAQEKENTSKDDACVEVEVDGVRAPSYDCWSQKLQPTATTTATRSGQLASEDIISRPSNQLGVFNRAATGHRMGNNFGTSVYPQRPPPTNFTSPLIPQR